MATTEVADGCLSVNRRVDIVRPIVSRELETVSTRLMLMNNVAEEMRHLNYLAGRDPRKRFTKLWKNLTDILWLGQAWEQIRRNKGSQTPGVNNTVAVD